VATIEERNECREMTDNERDEKIIEISTDIKWLKAWAEEHKGTHSKYLYYFIITMVGLLIALIK